MSITTNSQKQFVKMEEHQSVCLDIVGVPQGSCLGPQSFIDDLCKIYSLLKFTLSPDDTNILVTSDNLQQL